MLIWKKSNGFMLKNALLKKSVLAVVLVSFTIALSAVGWESAHFFGTGVVDVRPPFSCPNPFTEGDWVSFVFIPTIEGEVEVSVYTTSGLLVAQYDYADLTAAEIDDEPDYVLWPGVNFAGRSVAPGAYIWIVRITDPGTKKVEIHKGICFKM